MSAAGTLSVPIPPTPPYLLMAAVSLLVGSVFLVAVLALQFPNRAIFTRKRTDVPLVKGGKPLIGNLYGGLEHHGRRLERELEQVKEYGIVRRATAWPIFRKPVDALITHHPQDVQFVLSDPYLFIKDHGSDPTFKDMLGDGIFISDGHAWASSRKIASKLFTVKSFRDVFSRDFVEECDHLSAHLRKAADQGAVVDLQELLLRCTLDSFTRLALGKDPACLSGEGKVVDGRYTLPPSEFMTMFDLFVLLCSVRTIDPLWRFSEVFNGRGRMIAECKRVVHGFASEVIAEKRRANAAKADREKAADDRFDLLDHFMQSRNDDGSDLTDDQLRDAVSNFLLAGRDTTAQTLSWCFWEIAQRPEVAEKLREEALRVLGPDGPTTYESLKDLQYTYCVFQEVLRLHSNVPSMGKIATADTVLPGTGTKVYAGQEVNYSTFAMGYLPEVWGPDAAEFRPERWMLPGGGVMKQNTVKHPVFNSGPRLCLGMNFAQQEATVFLSTLIRRFKFTLVNEDDPEKWGAWNPDPAKRQGRYTEAITLGLRKGVDFALTPLM